MTWKRMMILMGGIMLLALAVMFYFLSRLDVGGDPREIMGVRSVFPAGEYAPVAGAENGWQGYAFAGRFRFFRRPSAAAAADHLELARRNAASAWRQADLDLFAGGLLALSRANKGYRVLCVFHRDGVNYWVDLVSNSSLDFGLQIVERFLLNLEIGGEKAPPALAGQLAALRGRISPFAIQTLPQMMVLMAAIFLLVMGITWAANRLGGSCPRRDNHSGDECTPYATLRISGFARRQLSACCLCREGDFLVIYRFRRPYLKIDLRSERQEIAWERTSFRYRNIRVIMAYEDFAKWRLRLMD